MAAMMRSTQVTRGIDVEF